MSPAEIKQKLSAAEKIFSESTTTLDKLKSAGVMLRGINPALDAKLVEYEKHLSLLENASEGAYVELSAEALPEDTEEKKKRKAVLILLLKSIKDLRSEIDRISKEMRDAKEAGASQTSLWQKILGSAKGPLALVTIVAVGIAALQMSAVEIEIRNTGCGTMSANTSIPSLPGLSLPTGDIPSGGSGIATVPPLTFEADGTAAGAVVLKAVGLSFSFELGNRVSDIRFNGSSLLGSKATLELASAKKHTLEVVCE